MSCPVISCISFASGSDVSGPVAIIVIASFDRSFIDMSFPISAVIVSINGLFFICSVTFFENCSLSTASAWPAGTFVSSAIFISSESNFLSSSFSSPHAFVIKFDFKELLHTISAKSLLLCAGVCFCGFISYSFTFIPFFAIWYAASVPAKPPPITFIYCSIFSFFLFYEFCFFLFFS